MSSVIRREDVPRAPTFSFQDLERLAADILEQAHAQARTIISAAHQQSQSVAERHKNEGRKVGLAAGRKAGLEEIRREARAATMQAAQADLDHLKRALASGLDEYEQGKRSLLAAAESGLIELALAIAQRVCKIMVNDSCEPARANARALLELVKHHGDIQLLVNPADHELLQDVAADFVQSIGGLQHASITPDAGVDRGGCVLRSSDGEIDASIAGQLERIAATLGVSASPAEGAPEEAAP